MFYKQHLFDAIKLNVCLNNYYLSKHTPKATILLKYEFTLLSGPLILISEPNPSHEPIASL